MLLISLISFTTTFASDANMDRPRVLVLRSLDNVRYDMKNIMSGFQAALNTNEVQMDVVDIHVGYLSDPMYEDGIERIISSMVKSGGEYDLLILVREPAVRYALHLEESFSETPVIFGMVENTELSKEMHDRFNAVQVNEPILLRENILLAGTLIDELNQVLIVLDGALDGSSIEAALTKQMSIFENELNIIKLQGDAIMSGKTNLEDYSMDNTLIYYLSEHHSANVFRDMKLDSSLVFTPWTNLVKGKVDGGRVLNATVYGEIIGENALRILAGESASELEVINVSSRYVFDYKNVYEKNLDLEWIENEAIFLGMDTANGGNGVLIAGMTILVFAVIVIIVLMVQHYLAHHQKSEATAGVFSQEIVQNVNTAISIKNEDRHYIHVNEKFNQLFNINTDVVGCLDSQIFPVEFAKELKSIDDRATFGSDDYDKKIIYNHMESGALYLEFKVKKSERSSGKSTLGKLYWRFNRAEKT